MKSLNPANLPYIGTYVKLSAPCHWYSVSGTATRAARRVCALNFEAVVAKGVDLLHGVHLLVHVALRRLGEVDGGAGARIDLADRFDVASLGRTARLAHARLGAGC